MLALGSEVNYLVDYFPSMVLSGVGVGCVLPQLSSVVAQALPENRRGVGGAALQAGRQFGGTFGVALTVAFLTTPAGLAAAFSPYDRVWWIIVAGGIATTALVMPLHTVTVGPPTALAPYSAHPTEVPEPVVADHDLLVEIRAASINPLDKMVRSGEFKQLLAYERPFGLGHQLSGIVTAVGPAVRAFEVGDEIYARPATSGSVPSPNASRSTRTTSLASLVRSPSRRPLRSRSPRSPRGRPSSTSPPVSP